MSLKKIMSILLVFSLFTIMCIGQIKNDLPTVEVVFSKGEIKLPTKAKNELVRIVKFAADSPSHKISIIAFSNGCLGGDKSWDRLFSVIKFLIKHGLKEDEFIFQFVSGISSSINIKFINNNEQLLQGQPVKDANECVVDRLRIFS